MNNPLTFIDPDGRGVQITIVEASEDGIYEVTDWVDDGKTDVITTSGDTIGISLSIHSFLDDNNMVVSGAGINVSSSEGEFFLDEKILVRTIERG